MSSGLKTAQAHNAPQVGHHEFRPATVMRDGFRGPLIGIPEAAVLQECDCCHHEFPLAQVELSGRQMLCQKCRKK